MLLHDASAGFLQLLPVFCRCQAVDAQKDAQTRPLPRDQLGQMVVGRGVGLEVTELLLLLGIQPPFTTSLFWRLVKAAVLVGHASVPSQTGWHAETFDLKRLLLLSLLCLAPGSQATDYVQCEAIQRAAARLKAAMDTEALASQNAIILPAMEKAKERCHAEFVNDEVLNCMVRRMAPYEAEGVLARESVVEKYAPRVDRVLDDYEAMSCY